MMYKITCSSERYRPIHIFVRHSNILQSWKHFHNHQSIQWYTNHCNKSAQVEWINHNQYQYW